MIEALIGGGDQGTPVTGRTWASITATTGLEDPKNEHAQQMIDYGKPGNELAKRQLIRRLLFFTNGRK
jgi:hypothetical protein